MATLTEAPTIVMRVQRGVDWLDERHPGWWQRINLDRFDMAHECRCVLGQMCGSYYAAPITLDESVRLGFDASTDWPGDDIDEAIDAEFEALTAEWFRVIEERREAAR